MSRWSISCGVRPGWTTNTAIDEPYVVNAKASPGSAGRPDPLRRNADEVVAGPSDLGDRHRPVPGAVRPVGDQRTVVRGQHHRAAVLAEHQRRVADEPLAVEVLGAQGVPEDPKPASVLQRDVRADVRALELLAVPDLTDQLVQVGHAVHGRDRQALRLGGPARRRRLGVHLGLGQQGDRGEHGERGRDDDGQHAHAPGDAAHGRRGHPRQDRTLGSPVMSRPRDIIPVAVAALLALVLAPSR